jgi:large subunit ribosomal protein L18
MSIHTEKKSKRLKRAKKTRAKLRELNTVRLVVNKSNKNIYAQIIVPGQSDQVVVSASTLDKEYKKNCGSTESVNIKTATEIGKLVAERAVAKGITKVAFDRSGFRYHGRIKALADAARENGLQF